MTHFDLFSGIGGFALAAQWAGIKTVGFSEIDPFCCKLLAKRFPGVENYGDIKKIDGRTIGPVDIITGGFPCQPFSVAGKQRGAEDDRHLWPEMFRIIKETRPNWVIGENVAGFVSMALDDVLSDLESEGYSTQAFIIPACAVNAPHRRDRAWIVAYSAGLFGNGGNNNDDECKQSKQISKFRDCNRTETFTDTGGKPEREQINKTITGANCRQTRNEFSGGCFNDSDTDSERCQERNLPAVASWPVQCGWGDDSNWIEAATRLCGVSDGISRRVDRLRALGNAIVPQVAFQIMQAIVTTQERIKQCQQEA